MAQIFKPSSNTVAPGVLMALVLTPFVLGLVTWLLVWSPYSTAVGVPMNQVVPFSHEHHVGGLGIDCRYCHTGVEAAAFAGIPSTHTCMTCHSQLWTEAPILSPIRESLVKNEPVRWKRVHALPDYVYFDHSIHIAKGISCVSCHGRVDQMPLIAKAQTLYMRWCLDCHRHPEEKLRDRADVFNMASHDPSPEVGRQRLKAYQIHPERLLDCSLCHR